jgi:hypothetical protein
MSKPVTLQAFFEVAKGQWAAVGEFYESPTLLNPQIPEDFMPWLFEDMKGGALQARLIAPSNGQTCGLWRDVEDAGLQAMGKKSREKRERQESGEVRAPRSNVAVLEDGVSIRGGTKEPFTLFYLKARKEWQDDSNTDLQKTREAMVFLDERGHFATAVKLAMVVKGGDQKTYRALGTLHSRPMSDDRVAEVEAFVGAEYARLFPYDSGLPIENNIYGWLLASMDNYRLGHFNAAQMESAIGDFAEVSPVRPALTAEGFKIGPFEMSRSEALKIVIGSLEKTVSDFLGRKNQAADVAKSILASFHGGRETQATSGLSRVQMFADAMMAVFKSELLDYLKRPDIPDGIKEKVAIISMLGTREGTFLADMFGSDIDPTGAGSKGEVHLTLRPSRMSPEAFGWKVETAYRKVFADGSQQKAAETDKTEEIKPLSLDEFFRSRRDVEKVNPRRSLTLFRYTDYFARLAIGRLAATNVGVAAAGPEVSMGFRALRRLLSSKKVSNETKAMAIDIFMHVHSVTPRTLIDVIGVILKLERDFGRLGERIREIYVASYPEAPDVLRAAEKLPKNDARSILSSEKFSEPGISMAWGSFLAEARRQGIEREKAIDLFAEVSAPSGSDQKIYEGWIKTFSGLSAGERVNLWKLLKSNNPRAVAVLFQDHLFPPHGAWVKGDAFVDRMGFLLPSELEGFQATLAAAAEDTAITYNVFTRRYPGVPVSDHSDLPKWLEFWSQDGGEKTALDKSLYELSRWVHGEGPLGVNPLLARELVRRSIGDTLAIRTLINFVSNPQLNPAQRQTILSETARILNLGEIEGDLLGLVMRANARINGKGQQPSKAELSSVEDALKNGWKVTLIPTDKKLSGPTPDIEAVGRDGKRVVVEVKMVSRGPVGDLGYLRKLTDQIRSATWQLEKYETGDARRIVHVYVTGYGPAGISELAMREAEETIENGGRRSVDEIVLIPVDVNYEGWREGAPVRGIFDEDLKDLKGDVLARLSPIERERMLQSLRGDWERLSPLDRGPFKDFVARRTASLSTGATAEGKEAASAAREKDRTEEGRKEGAERDKTEKMERAETKPF